MYMKFVSSLAIAGISIATTTGVPGFVTTAEAFGLCSPDNRLLAEADIQRELGLANTLAIGVSAGTLNFDDPFIDENADFVDVYGSYGATLYDSHVLQLNAFGGTFDDQSDEITSLGGSVQFGIKDPLATGAHAIDAGFEQTRFDTFSTNDYDTFWIGGQGRCYTKELTVGASIGYANIDFDNSFLESIDALYFSGDVYRYVNPNTRLKLGFDAARFEDSSSGASVFRVGAGIDWQFSPEQPFVLSFEVGQKSINSDFPGNYFEVTDFKVGLKYFLLDGSNGRTPSLQEYDVRGINFHSKPRPLDLFR